MDAEVQKRIEKAISNNDILLFMKGTRDSPSCGFSAKTIEILNSLTPTYATVDVLSHPEIREGIKEFSSWPTIPQLYVRGKFVGGADIVAQMYESGDLHETLGLAGIDSSPPQLILTEAARQAFQEFLADSGEVVLLEIDRDFQGALSIGPTPAHALTCVAAGITIAMDRLSATRAEGLHIDFITTADGAAFKLTNPNEPAHVKPLNVSSLKRRMDAGESLRLIDVRRPDEWETAKIVGAELLDSDLMEQLLALPKDTVLICQCHHGHRSQRVAEQLVAQGFTEVYNLTGGIEAWSLEVDKAVPRY